MTGPASGQRKLLASLAEAEIDFVLVGGHAVAAHGYERATRDVDIVFSTESGSCARLAGLLNRLEASIQTADLPAPNGEITADWLTAGGHFVFETRHGPLDALTWIAGLDFPSLDARAETARLADGTELRVCGYQDLVAMKRSADRPRDRDDLEQLQRIREQPGA